MKKIRVVVLVLFLISLFVSIDLGLNFLYNLVTEHLDGFTSHSILQGLFGILGDRDWTLPRFFDMFETSLWISFGLLVLNTMLTVVKKD